jgi:hypothetical protein
MIQPSTEIEMMRTLHTLWMGDLITWEQVELLLLQSCQLELTYMNQIKIMTESLDGKTKYKIE